MNFRQVHGGPHGLRQVRCKIGPSPSSGWFIEQVLYGYIVNFHACGMSGHQSYLLYDESPFCPKVHPVFIGLP